MLHGYVDLQPRSHRNIPQFLSVKPPTFLSLFTRMNSFSSYRCRKIVWSVFYRRSNESKSQYQPRSPSLLTEFQASFTGTIPARVPLSLHLSPQGRSAERPGAAMARAPATGRPKSINNFLVTGRAAAVGEGTGAGALRPFSGNTVMRRPSRGGGVCDPAVGGRPGTERPGVPGVAGEDDEQGGGSKGRETGRFSGGSGESGAEAQGGGGGVELPTRPVARPTAAKGRHV